MNGDEYNQDYFERGIELGISGYHNYRWMPEFTIPMAMTMIDYLNIRRGDLILDYGCAKGYLVKAFRLLYRQAWGCDISKYALSMCDPDVSPFCHLIGSMKPLGFPRRFNVCIAKDVLEHLDEGEVGAVLEKIGDKSDLLFAIIPLGKDQCYVAPINNVDITHKLCCEEEWWEKKFKEHGWKLRELRFRIDGIKDHFYEKYPKAHGFFLLEKELW